MSNSKVESSGGVSFFTLLGVLFIGLKLAKVISWTWPYVLLPLWGPFVVVMVVLIVVLLVHAYGDD